MIFEDAALQGRFDADGFVTLPLLPPAHVARMLALYESTVASDPKKDLYESSRHNTLEKNSQINLAIRDVLSDAVGGMFGDHELFGGTFMVKVPEQSTVLALHQDWSVIDEDTYQSAFIWCPLVDTGPANGGLFVLPGSHRWFGNYRSGSMPSLRIVPQGPLKSGLKDMHLAAGEAIIYSDRLFHGSYANTSASPRIIATGRVNERGAQLVYYHRMDDGTVALVNASPEFYLKEIDALAHGRLPEGSEIVRTFPHAYRPVTEADLLAQVQSLQSDRVAG
jgi:ectoine hydroxylase-related dioxygenase (phytanoyl-CoA dioxygenase family)